MPAKLSKEQHATIKSFIYRKTIAKIRNLSADIVKEIMVPIFAKRDELIAEFRQKYDKLIKQIEAEAKRRDALKESIRKFNEDICRNKSGLHDIVNSSWAPTVEDLQTAYVRSIIGFYPKERYCKDIFCGDLYFVRLEYQYVFVNTRDYSVNLQEYNVVSKIHLEGEGWHCLQKLLSPADIQAIELKVAEYNRVVAQIIGRTEELVILSGIGRTAADLQALLSSFGIEFDYLLAVKPDPTERAAIEAEALAAGQIEVPKIMER